MPRMTREMIGDGIRQQFDVTAAMATRLDKEQTEENVERTKNMARCQSGTVVVRRSKSAWRLVIPGFLIASLSGICSVPNMD